MFKTLMKKLLILLAIVISGALCFSYFVGNKEEKVLHEAKPRMPAKKRLIKKSESSYENEINDFSKLDEKVEVVAGKLSSKKDIGRSRENEIREEMLESFFDKNEFKQRTSNVFQRYENEKQTADGLKLQASLQDKIYSSGVYDSLKEKNIEFSDVHCKMSLCKFDFKASQKNNVDIVRALATKIMPSDGKANISSKINDGKISFYIARGFLVE